MIATICETTLILFVARIMNNDAHPELYLIGFRIEPDIFEPNVYSIYVDDDGPLLYCGQPVLFPRAELAAKVIGSAGKEYAHMVAPSDVQAVYDVVEAVFTIQERDEDRANHLLDCVNLLLDYIKCLNIKVPGGYDSDLRMLADHVTFDASFAGFLKEHQISRERLVDALYWGIGMVLYNSKIIV